MLGHERVRVEASLDRLLEHVQRPIRVAGKGEGLGEMEPVVSIERHDIDGREPFGASARASWIRPAAWALILLDARAVAYLGFQRMKGGADAPPGELRRADSGRRGRRTS